MSMLDVDDMEDDQPSITPDITRFASATTKRRLSFATADIDEIFKRARQASPKARTFFWNDHSAWPGLKKKTSPGLPALGDSGGSSRDDDESVIQASSSQNEPLSPKTSAETMETLPEPEPKKISFYLRIDNTLIPMLAFPDPSIPLTTTQLAKVDLALTDMIVKPFHSPEVYAGRAFAPDPFKLAKGKAEGSTPRRRESAPTLGLDFGQELAGQDMPLRTEECVVRMPVDGYPPARVATPMPAKMGLRNRRKPVPAIFPPVTHAQVTASPAPAVALTSTPPTAQASTSVRRDSIQPYPSVLFAPPPKPSPAPVQVATPTIIPPTPPASEPVFFNPQGWGTVPPNVSADLQLWYDIPMAPVQFDCSSSFLPSYHQQPYYGAPPPHAPLLVDRRASMPSYAPSTTWKMTRTEKEDADLGMFLPASSGISQPQPQVYTKHAQPIQGWTPVQHIV